MKDCGSSITDPCFADKYALLNSSNQHTVDYNIDTKRYRVVLADGSAFMVRVTSPKCDNDRGNNKFLKHICGHAYIDINGHKKPNFPGKDMFEFHITEYGIYPKGTNLEYEDSPSVFNSDGGCSNTTKKGYTCSAWVLTKGNMDYLHHTVSW